MYSIQDFLTVSLSVRMRDILILQVCTHNTREDKPFLNLISDTCYVLSFAIIMLNTSLHNHNVRDKPTVERFISMNRGINEGGDLPEELLRVS